MGIIHSRASEDKEMRNTRYQARRAPISTLARRQIQIDAQKTEIVVTR